jgi:DUF971 family protein
VSGPAGGSGRSGDAAPVGLVLHTDRAELEVQWADGSSSRFPYAWLRRCCRCAGCTAARRAQGEAIPYGGSAPVSVIDVEPQGSYGIQLRFDDGHDRGIYPWRYLREIDPGAGA